MTSTTHFARLWASFAMLGIATAAFAGITNLKTNG